MDEQVNDFDLTTYVPEGAVPVGYVASVKYLSAEGDVLLRDLMFGVPTHEALGMSVALNDMMRAAMIETTHGVEED